MKPTSTTAAPAMKIINGKPCVRVIDLAKAWHTSTASILATGKPHHIPEEFLRRIDGRVWCQLAGLRYRLKAVKQDSNLNWCIREFLDTQEEKRTPTAPKPTDLGTAALIADARRTASQALNRANEADNFAYDANTLAKANDKRIGKLEIRMDSVEADVYSLKHDTRRDHVARHQSASATVVSDKNTGRINDLATRVHDLDVRAKALEHDVPQLLHAMCSKERVETLEKQMGAVKLVVKSTANIAEEASEAVDRIGAAVEQQQQQAADLAKENADIIRGEIERLTQLSDDVDKATKKAQARHDGAMAHIMSIERKQRDNAARIRTLEEHARAIDWTLAAVAMLGVVGRLARLLRRR